MKDLNQQLGWSLSMRWSGAAAVVASATEAEAVAWLEASAVREGRCIPQRGQQVAWRCEMVTSFAA